MKILLKHYRLLFFLIITTAVFSVLFLGSNYRHYPAISLEDFILIGAHWFLLTLGLFCTITVLSINKWIFALVFPIITIIASGTAFFVWQFDVSINSALFQSFLYTDAEEAYSYFSFQLLLYLTISVGLSIYAAKFRFKLKWNKQQIIATTLLFAICFSIFSYTNKKRLNTLTSRSPFSYYPAIKDYMAEKREIKKVRKLLGENAYTTTDSLITVFVIGEALRADHIQMNGYHRETMPNMEKRAVVSLPRAYSPYTHTANSLMYILSRAQNDSLDAMYLESSFIDIFKSSSFHTAWIGNQNPIKTYKYFVNECDTFVINKPHFSDFSNVVKLDSDLIFPFSNIIKKENAKQLAIIHLAGNHWWYNKNFPDSFAVFTPILESKIISAENRERMINSYDNVTLFVDFVLDSMIELIKDKNSILIFLSDHGQSFGEGGKWLHANNMPSEKNPACFFWFSDKYKTNNPEKVQNLLSNQLKEINTSFLFHTIIDGGAIHSPYLKRSLSLFSSEFQQEREDSDSEKE